MTELVGTAECPRDRDLAHLGHVELSQARLDETCRPRPQDGDAGISFGPLS